MSNFLEDITLSDGTPLSPDERREIEALGVESAPDLLAALRADRAAARRLFGKERAALLIEALERITGDHATQAEIARRRPRFATGAIAYARRPRLAAPAYDLSERDRLFAELQALRAEPQPTEQTRERIESIEAQLNHLLEGAGQPAR